MLLFPMYCKLPCSRSLNATSLHVVWHYVWGGEYFNSQHTPLVTALCTETAKQAGEQAEC